MPHSPNRLEQLVNDQVGFVHGWAVHLAPAAGMADDITQQVFAEFLAKAGQWDLESDIRPLLVGMTRIVAKRCWRERARRMSPELAELAEHIRQLNQDEAPPIYDESERDALRHCLSGLPPRSQRLVRLHYDLGIPAAEVAGQVDMKADAVRRALFRIRNALRDCITGRLGRPAHG